MMLYHAYSSAVLFVFFRKDSVLDWQCASDVFKKLRCVLEIETYRYWCLYGMIISVGGLTESLVRHSSFSLLSVFDEAQGRCRSLALSRVYLLSFHPSTDSSIKLF
jgi:hypothetical protein